jgi:sec-independent protein translocase protein TatA
VPGHWEIVVLAVVVLLLFGSSRVPQIARQLGSGLREVKGTLRDVDVREDMRRALEAPEDEARAAGAATPRDD